MTDRCELDGGPPIPFVTGECDGARQWWTQDYGCYVQLQASKRGVYFQCEGRRFTPLQARYLAELLNRAADESERRKYPTPLLAAKGE